MAGQFDRGMAMTGIMAILFTMIFIFVFATIIIGSIRTMSMSSKVFNIIERQLNNQLAAQPDESQRQTECIVCAHCGSSVKAAEKCPNCGATLA